MALLHDGGKTTAVTMPAGAEVKAPEPDASPDATPNRLTEALWDGKIVSMFQIDLLERGERIRSAGM